MDEAAKRPILRRVITDSSERILMASKPIFAEKDKSESTRKKEIIKLR